MASSCLVPDFPAVMVALEHLKELDQQLKEDGVPFSPEASLHLSAITAAVAELEADCRAAHDLLEVETIENSKLRHRIVNISEEMNRECAAAVAAARAADAQVMEQLREDLDAVSQAQDAADKRREALLSREGALRLERARATAEHEEVVAVQNEEIASRYDSQKELDDTRGRIEALASGAAAARRDGATLREKMAGEREAFAAGKDALCAEANRAAEEAKRRKRSFETTRGELDEIDAAEREARNRLSAAIFDVARLESGLRKLSATRRQNEIRLRGEARTREELRRRKETLKEEARESEEAFRAAVRRLEDDVAAEEDRITAGRASGSRRRDSLARVYEVFKRWREEEEEARAEHLLVWRELERSKLQLEERVSSVVKHGKEAKEMDRQIRELREAEAVGGRVFERSRAELRDDAAAEEEHVGRLEEEKRRLAGRLEEAKRRQEEHVAKVTADIGDAGTRYRELRGEEAALRERRPASAADELEAERGRKEAERREEAERCAAETASAARSREEKLRELEEQEEALEEAAAACGEERARHRRSSELTSEFRSRRSELKRCVRGLRENTASLLRPKEELRAALAALRGGAADALGERAAALMAVEVAVYDDAAKLELVGVENSRLRLRVRQMTEELDGAREAGGRRRREARRLERGSESSLRSLRDAWEEDAAATREGQSADGVPLAALSGVLERLEARRRRLGGVETLLQQQMLDFSRRLGDKTIAEQQSGGIG
ncbi:hypothetical protein EYF80_043327 [Liparis tanakae]|uniref:Uncharacterized protein n=1 Tax=Liparis tanakae TaxID=230148 RepID=A0A4Z2FYZ0_9TELE|nr:hypothetical protein EYF80_043327 [Liparis tanakae]